MTEPVPYCHFIPNAAPPDLIDFAAKFVRENLYRFTPNPKGPARRSFKFDSRTDRLGWPLLAFKNELCRRFALGPYDIPPKLMDFMTYVTEGGFVHTHTDQDLVGRQHVRINILMSQPEGCVPVMDGIPIDVPVGGAWLNLASKVPHATTAVVGSGYRTAISFGYQIDPARGAELYEEHLAWRRAQTGETISMPGEPEAIKKATAQRREAAQEQHA